MITLSRFLINDFTITRSCLSMKRKLLFSRMVLPLILISTVIMVSCNSQRLADGLYANLKTVKGTITIRLEPEKAPLTVANFVGLAEGTLDVTQGIHFYDGLTFHRVEPGFVIQGGDPRADGTGSAGYLFPDEIVPELKHDAPGVVAMANSGPNSNGTQFYITLAALPPLDGNYTIFGRVVKGMDVVNSIAKGDVIKSITIQRIGAKAKAYKATQELWDELFGSAVAKLRAKSSGERQAALEQMKKRWPNLVLNERGLYTMLVKEGSGEPIYRGVLAHISYKAMLPNGTIFDRSELNGTDFVFEVGAGQVIPGWDLAIIGMKKGEKRVIAIPPELAYGTQGYGKIIPPNTFIVLEIEVKDIEW
mgnify:CR=1 FL=1